MRLESSKAFLLFYWRQLPVSAGVNVLFRRERRRSDETTPRVCRASSRLLDSAVERGSPVGIVKGTDGVVARAGEKAVGEGQSLVVVPPNDPGHPGVEGRGVEDALGVSRERRGGHAVVARTFAAKCVLMSVKLRRE